MNLSHENDEVACGGDNEVDEVMCEKDSDRGQGYLELGLYEEAEAVLNGVPEESSSFFRAQNILLRVDHDLARFERGAKRCRRLLADYGPDCVRFQFFANCLLYLERFEEARQLASLREERWWESPVDAYTIACIETKRGDFVAALKWFRQSVELSDESAVYGLFDSHLTALWRRVGRLDIEFDADLASDLAASVFERVAVLATGGCKLMGIDHEARRTMPSRLRRSLVLDPRTALYRPDCCLGSESRKTRREIVRFQRRRVLRSLAGLRAGMRVAREQGGQGLADCFEEAASVTTMPARRTLPTGLN